MMTCCDTQESSIDNQSIINNFNIDNNNTEKAPTPETSNKKMTIQSSLSNHQHGRSRHNLVNDIIESLKRKNPYYIDLSIQHIPNEYITYYDIEDILNTLKTNTIVRRVEIWLPKIPKVIIMSEQQQAGAMGHNSHSEYYQCLIDCLSYNHNIKQLCILSVQDDIGWQSLCIGLCKNQSSIEELIIGNDDDEGMVSSSFDNDDDTIMTNSTTTSEIDNHNDFDEENYNCYMKLNHTSCYTIQIILSKLHQLKSFALHGCIISSSGIQMIANGIEYHALLYDTLMKFELQQIIANEGFGPILIALSKLNHIQTLHIIDCNLTSLSSLKYQDDLILPFEYLFRNTKSLQHVRLIQCQLSSNDTTMQSICYGISYNTSISTLDLRNNDINDCCEYLGQMLYYNNSIQKLILEQNHINNDSLYQLCTIGLRYNTSLQHLNVMNNHITDISCLLNIFPNISTDDSIANNDNTTIISSASSKLNTLLLSYNHIGNAGANILGMILHQFYNLEIEGCSINDDGIYDLCNGLLETTTTCHHNVHQHEQQHEQENDNTKQQQYPPPSKRRRQDSTGMMNGNDNNDNSDIRIRINKLNMSHNLISGKGALGISNILSCHDISIKSLHLRSCQLNDQCIQMITNGIINRQYNNNSNGDYNSNNNKYSLKELNISFNNIQNDGAKYISQMIQNRYCYIEILNIQYNDFNEIGINCIIESLRYNYYIKELLIYNTNISCYDYNDIMQHWLRLNASGRCFIPSTTLNHYHHNQYDNNNHNTSNNNHHINTTTNSHDDNHNRTTGSASKSCKPSSSSSSSTLWPQLLLSHANREYGATAVFHLLMEMPHIQ